MTIEEFRLIDLRVAKIVSAERIEGSEKLIKMRISLGEEERPLVAGIGNAYEPSALLGKEIVVVVNLEPRTLMGEESRGMLLAATDSDGLPALLVAEREVPPGVSVK